MAKPPEPPPPGASSKSADYSVGYGKPPKARQFRKGQSGNPSGGSKKARARKVDGNGSPFDQILLHEIARPVTITENGKRTKITTSRAIGRSLMIDAAKGNRSAQKLVIDRVQAAHDRQQATATERFGLLVQYFTSQITTQNGPTAGSPQYEQSWPRTDDLELNYTSCTGRVVGPIDAEQAQPFIALVGEHRLWRARLDQVLTIASQSRGEMRTHFGDAITAINSLLGAIRDQLPPSFKIQLDRDDGDQIPAGALDVANPGGDTINLALLSPEGSDTFYVLHLVTAWAEHFRREMPRKAKLDIAANTTSLINRLLIEKQNRDGGAPPAPTVPDFDQFYGEIAFQGHGNIEEAGQ